MILAGVRRNSGLVLDTQSFALSEIRGLLERFLNFGEYCFDKLVSFLLLSLYFKQISLGSSLRQKAYDYVKKQIAEVE